MHTQLCSGLVYCIRHWSDPLSVVSMHWIVSNAVGVVQGIHTPAADGFFSVLLPNSPWSRGRTVDSEGLVMELRSD